MISFDTSYTRLGFNNGGAFSEVPTNNHLRLVQIQRGGVVVMDDTGNWGTINYQDTSFISNVALFNYLYPYTQINKTQTRKIEVCSADFLACNSVPIELVEAQGIGLIILPQSLGYFYRYKSVVYNFAQNLYVHCSTKTDSDNFITLDKGIVNAAANRSSIIGYSSVAGVSNDDALVENDSMVLKAKTSDATTGDGYITLYLTYTVVEEAWFDGIYCT